jgi:hypothetical protein
MKLPMHKSRTLWFSFALVVFGAVFDNFTSIQGVIGDRYYGISYIIIGVVVATLRFLTTQPLDKK